MKWFSAFINILFVLASSSLSAKNESGSFAQDQLTKKTMIRKAALDDVKEMILLSSQKRKQYEKYQPIFQKEAKGAIDFQTKFFKDSLFRENVIALVSVVGNSKIDGFIIGTIVNSPPVYNPGGKICLVDDFMVSDSSLWGTVGKNLLDRVVELGKGKGAVLANVVCGPLDKPKKEMLNQYGFQVATEWNVKWIK